MATFAYFLHPPRENFAESMTDQEEQAWGQHVAWLQELYAADKLILVGVTLGRINTGVSILEADDEQAARELVAGDPVTQAGLAEGDLRPFSVGMIRSTPPGN